MPIGSINENGETSITDFQQIITFKKDSIEAILFGWEKDTLVSYSIKGDSMFYSGVETKYSLQNDSILKIDIYGETVIFKTFNEGNNRYSAQQLFSALKGTEWEFKDDSSGERYFSFDSIDREAYTMREYMENVYSFDRFDMYNEKIFQELGFWTVKAVNGQILLNLNVSYGRNDYIILQLEEIKNNEIIFKGWIRGIEKKVRFIKVPKLGEDEIEIFNSKLTGSEWLLKRIKVVPNEFSAFSFSTESYFQSIDTTLLIKKEDLKLNRVSYQFDQDLTFSIFIDNRKAYSGTWSILLGGKILKLEEKWHGEENWYPQIESNIRIYERFLKIKSLKDEEFIFIREENLYSGFGSYEMEYIEQKYKKRR